MPVASEIYLETPDIDWIVRKQAMEDVFYEHCSIFDKSSLGFGLASAGFDVIDVSYRFGGQYLWAHARVSHQASSLTKCAPTDLHTIATDEVVADWRSRLKTLQHDAARVVVWGAGAKGMTFCQAVDPERKLIAALVDLNPNKHQRHIGASGHVVVGPMHLKALTPTHAIVVNPVYCAEIATELSRQGLKIELLKLQSSGT